MSRKRHKPEEIIAKLRQVVDRRGVPTPIGIISS